MGAINNRGEQLHALSRLQQGAGAKGIIPLPSICPSPIPCLPSLPVLQGSGGGGKGRLQDVTIGTSGLLASNTTGSSEELAGRRLLINTWLIKQYREEEWGQISVAMMSS